MNRSFVRGASLTASSAVLMGPVAGRAVNLVPNPDQTCSMEYPGEYTLAGGTPAGPGTTCTPSPCLPTGARSRTCGR